MFLSVYGHTSYPINCFMYLCLFDFLTTYIYFLLFVLFANVVTGAWAPPADDPLNIAPDESGVYHFTFSVCLIILY